LLFGGEDNDFIDGNQGTDTVFLGAGNDTFQWDPGDGSDTVEGDAGEDTLVFNGSNTNEIFDVSADAGRVRFTRNIGAIVMSVDGVEQFDLQTLGGIDAVTVNNLAGTALTDIAIDLAATGGATGDSTADSIVVNGTQAADTIGISGINGEVLVSGLAADTHITHSEPTLDQLTVNGLGGVDSIIQGPGVPAMIMVTINQ
jgi:Ca2+-binding RTX toxin-like protein